MQIAGWRSFAAQPECAPHGNSSERVVPLADVRGAESQTASGYLQFGSHRALHALQELTKWLLKAADTGHTATNRCRSHVLHLEKIVVSDNSMQTLLQSASKSTVIIINAVQEMNDQEDPKMARLSL